MSRKRAAAVAVTIYLSEEEVKPLKPIRWFDGGLGWHKNKSVKQRII